MSAPVLQRAEWHGEPKDLGESFRVRKLRCGGAREAVCRLWSHQFGWELRLEIAGNLLRSHVWCRSQDDVITTVEQWKTAMMENGWH